MSSTYIGKEVDLSIESRLGSKAAARAYDVTQRGDHRMDCATIWSVDGRCWRRGDDL